MTRGTYVLKCSWRKLPVAVGLRRDFASPAPIHPWSILCACFGRSACRSSLASASSSSVVLSFLAALHAAPAAVPALGPAASVVLAPAVAWLRFSRPARAEDDVLVSPLQKYPFRAHVAPATHRCADCFAVTLSMKSARAKLAAPRY